MTSGSADAPAGEHPTLTVVVLAWNNLELTRQCVESVRATTTVDYELVVVDNGSRPPAPAFAERAADVAVLHPTNLGFAAGMNSGLQRARGEYVAFLNNDAVLPTGWDVRLLQHFSRPGTGLVVPAVTAAGNRLTVRDQPGLDAMTLPPFRAVPSGVLYVLRTSVARELGGWDERYCPAGAEDADLCFQIWTNGLDVVLDERVLLVHVSKASVSLLTDQRAGWARNRQRLLRKWRGHEPVAVLSTGDAAAVARRRRQARHVAWLMTLYFATVGRLPEKPRQALLPPLRRTADKVSRLAASGPLTSRRSR